MKRLSSLVVALLLSLLILNLVSFFFGAAPATTLRALFAGTLGSGYGTGQILFKATPILFSALGARVAMRAGLFNIGVEGQLLFTSFMVGSLGTFLGDVPSVVAWLCLLIVSLVAGALWASIPASLRISTGAHEVLTTLIMNRLADPFVGFLLVTFFLVTGGIRTSDLPPTVLLPKLDRWFEMFRGSAVNVSIVMALVLFPLFQFFEKRTLFGRTLALIGSNPDACKHARIPVKRWMFLAMLLSGAIAGLGAMSTVVGYKGYFEQGLGAGSGFLGIAVALAAGESLFSLLFLALLFGFFEQGGLAINAHVPREGLLMIEAIVLVVVVMREAKGRGASKIGATQ